jgi:hypothetical protein
VRRAKFYVQTFYLGLSLIFVCSIALAQVADRPSNQAQQPGAEPTNACESLYPSDFPKVFKSSAWMGKATSRHHIWDCGANERRKYDELWFQIGLSVAGDRITGGFSCMTKSFPLKAPGGGTYWSEPGRGGPIVRGRVSGSYYSFHVVFCDDHAESCDLRGRKVADIIAGRYDCRRAGKRLDSGIWTVEAEPVMPSLPPQRIQQLRH